MKIRIGNVEFLDVTPDEVDGLIKRYGKLGPEASAKKGALKSQGDNNPSGGAAPVDRVLLKKLVDAGTGGIKTNDIGEVLGKRGKAIPIALRDWSLRIGLTTDIEATMDTFESCRVGTSRGLRIKANLMDVAKILLGNPD